MGHSYQPTLSTFSPFPAAGSMILITNLSIQPSPATVFQGQTVVFNCTYSESVSARVAWLRDGRPWAGSQTSDLPNGGRLRVENVTRELNGSEVTCVVDVGGGSTAEASTHLTVLGESPVGRMRVSHCNQVQLLEVHKRDEDC